MALKVLKPALRTATSGPPTITTRAKRKTGSGLQATRRRIFERDGYRCQCHDCKGQSLRVATIVDHRVPLWAGGADEDHNRQSINAECHDAKSAHEAACRSRGVFVPWMGRSK